MTISILTLSSSQANEVNYQDWSGIYFPKRMYENNKAKLPNFGDFPSGEHVYILITTWKDKLIFKHSSKSYSPVRLGYFDSEIKQPTKHEQFLVNDKCKVKINLDRYKLSVDMNSKDDCNTAINVSGEYIKYDFYERSMLDQKSLPKEDFYLGAIPKGELFLGKFYNADICDKATQYKTNEEDLMWTKDKVLKEFVDEAKRRKLDCGVEINFEAFVLACLRGETISPENCQQLRDTRGPYPTKGLCLMRAYQIVNDMPKYKPKMESRGYRCDEV